MHSGKGPTTQFLVADKILADSYSLGSVRRMAGRGGVKQLDLDGSVLPHMDACEDYTSRNDTSVHES